MKPETEEMLKNMEAYRQGYEQGRTDGIKSFQRIIEKICIDINEIKEKIK